jgi:hypothetical protein
MSRLKYVLELLVSSLFYSIVVICVDFLLVLFFTQELKQLLSWVSFILLIEGGLGLILGGIVASYSPVMSKFDEMVFRSEPWSMKRQRAAEQQGQILIITGLFLLLTALLVSAI